MQSVGFIGLGNMGGPVAGHIQRAGFPMIVCDLRAEAMRPFRERGAKVVDSIAELANRSDIIMTALPMPHDVEKVATAILEGIKPAAIYIDISTNPPSLMRSFESRFAAKGAHLLDAPVASGQPGAARGIHEVMVGGEKTVFERAKPVLDAFGDQVIYAGPLGSGSICKLVHQMINSTVAQAIAEGLTLGVKAGVDTVALWECVRRGMVGRMHVLHSQVPQNVFTQRLCNRHISAQATAQRYRARDRLGPRPQCLPTVGEHRRANTHRGDESRMGRSIRLHGVVQTSGRSGASDTPRRRGRPAKSWASIFRRIPTSE